MLKLQVIVLANYRSGFLDLDCFCYDCEFITCMYISVHTDLVLAIDKQQDRALIGSWNSCKGHSATLIMASLAL